jgi:type VI secretion system secreted protein Hcp
MGTEAYLQIKGVDGEAQDSNHKNWMELESYSFGANNSGTAALGQGMGHGKATLNDFHFVPKGDTSTPILFLKTCTGDHIPEAVLELQKTGGTKLVYLKITFTELVLSSCQLNGSAHSDVPNTGVSFNFTKIKMESTAQNQEGGKGKTVTAGFDVKAGMKL